jgi:glutamyl-tRNA synthetase
MLTRLAPSPTGALHLGNARTFLINWALARQNGWRILLRIEDLDGPRIKEQADRLAMEDLAWLGIDWDEGPIHQSTRSKHYDAAVDRLLASNQAYPCICTRREITLAASAPHAEDGASVYPGTCHRRFVSMDQARDFAGREPAIRFHLTEGELDWEDGFQGRRHTNPAKELGDFIVRKADGTAAYQLAVVVDDAEMGVTHVVRGDDLLDSTPRQVALYRALGLEPSVPQYLHLPLILGPDGRRLAKRHGDTRLAAYRNAGVSPARILQSLARWSGIDHPEKIQCAMDFAQAFRLDRCPREPIRFSGL